MCLTQYQWITSPISPPADAEACVQDAADLCPVQIIRIEES
jgi:ferredoxin